MVHNVYIMFESIVKQILSYFVSGYNASICNLRVVSDFTKLKKNKFKSQSNLLIYFVNSLFIMILVETFIEVVVDFRTVLEAANEKGPMFLIERPSTKMAMA